MTGRACWAKFATGATTGKTTVATGEMIVATAGMTGKTTVATGEMTGKTVVVAGPGCSGDRELDVQGGHAAARSAPWRLQTGGAAWRAGRE